MKKIILLSIGFLLLVAGPFACSGGAGPGGAASPLGGPGGAGGYGAPPISIPGPEALNMDAISVTGPDTSGSAVVSGGPGAGTAGDTVHVRSLGPVASNNPFKNFFLKKAYAAAGGSFSAVVLPDGAFKGTVPGVAPGDVLEMFQCFPAPKAGCSVPIYYKIGTGPVSPPPGSIKSFYMGKDGSAYTGSQNKKWKWTHLFISEAYADDVAPAGVAPLAPVGVLPGIVVESLVDRMRGYTGATCPAPDFTGNVTPQRTDKVCIIQKTANGSNTPTEFARISDCDPNTLGIFVYDDGSGERLAAFSQNKLWLFRAATKALENKYSYWANIAKMHFFNGVLAVALNVPAGSSLPAIAANHSCLNNSLLKTVREFGGFDSDGVGTFAFTVRDQSNKSFAVLGPSTEFIMDTFNKVEPSVQDSRLTEIVLLPASHCGYNFVALSPDTREIVTGYFKHTIPEWAATCSESSVQKVAIPRGNSPVGLAWDKNNTLVVLDSSEAATRLISFSVELRDDKYTLTYANTVDLSSPAHFVRFNASHNEFVTDAPSTSDGAKLVRVSSTRLQTVSLSPTLLDGAVGEPTIPGETPTSPPIR